LVPDQKIKNLNADKKRQNQACHPEVKPLHTLKNKTAKKEQQKRQTGYSNRAEKNKTFRGTLFLGGGNAKGGEKTDLGGAGVTSP